MHGPMVARQTGVATGEPIRAWSIPGARRIGDYSLNAANELTVDLLFGKGLERIVPSYDLNWEQFQALLARFAVLAAGRRRHLRQTACSTLRFSQARR